MTEESKHAVARSSKSNKKSTNKLKLSACPTDLRATTATALAATSKETNLFHRPEEQYRALQDKLATYAAAAVDNGTLSSKSRSGKMGIANLVQLAKELEVLVPQSILAVPRLELRDMLSLSDTQVKSLLMPCATAETMEAPVVQIPATAASVAFGFPKRFAPLLVTLGDNDDRKHNVKQHKQEQEHKAFAHYRLLEEPLAVAMIAPGQQTPFSQPGACHDNAHNLAYFLQAILPDAAQQMRMFGNLLVFTGVALSRDGIWRPHSWLLWRRVKTPSTLTMTPALETLILETTEERILYLGVKVAIVLPTTDWAKEISQLPVEVRAKAFVKLKKQLCILPST
jgi:hypothetical protein